MAATITKLPEWKCLTKFIHKKFPKHYLMLQYVPSAYGRFNFIIAKKSSLPFLSNDDIIEYDPMRVNYAGIDIEEIEKVDPMLSMYMKGLHDGGIDNNTVLNFMSHPQLKDNANFFKFLFKYIATGYGHCDHYDKMQAIKVDNAYTSENDPTLWYCAIDRDGWFEEFKILNDLAA